MSVLIKNMDMPKNCKKGNCPFRGIGGCVSGRYEEVWCHAADNCVEWEVVSDERSKDCPLVEVSDVPLTYKGEVIGWLNGEAERNIILELTGRSVPFEIIESEV